MTDDAPLSAAIEAHTRGWTPIPLRPLLKAPASGSWPDLSYASPEDVSTTWRSVSEHHEGVLNLGLALGSAHGGLVDIDLDHHKALAVASQILPETAMRSGRPGRPGSHFWYRVDGYDPGIKALKLPDGSVIVEFRAGGGQTACPPSRHPDGEDYEWYGEPFGGEDGPLHLDADEGKSLHATVLVIALLVTLAENWPRKGGRHAAFLPLVGGLLRDADEDGQPRVHPLWDRNIEQIVRLLVDLTNDADGARARINESVETTRRKIVKGEKVQGWPTLAGIIGEDHVRKAREFIEAVEELGDMPRAKVRRGSDEWWDESAPALRVVGENEKPPTRWESPEQRDMAVALLDDNERDPLEERLNQWESVDLGPYVRGGWTPPQPGILSRADSKGLIYPGRVNLLYGEGGSGKTLIALDMARQVLSDGGRVLLMDFEDEPVNTITRMKALGIPEDDLTGERFAYLHPERHPLAMMQVNRWGQHEPTPRGRESVEVLDRVLNETQPDLIVVDGTTSLYRIHGLDTNSVQGVDVVGGWLRDLTANYTRTVVLIDHTGKNAGPESGPIGSQHKIAMVQGVALRVKTDARPRPGGIGSAALLVGKDRLGEVMAVSTDTDPPIAAEVKFDSTGDRLLITYAEPNPASTPSVQVVSSGSTAASGGGQRNAGRPSKRDQYRGPILTALRDNPTWLTAVEVRMAVGVTSTSVSDKTFRAVLDDLVTEGKVERKDTSGKPTRFRAVPASGD